MDYMDVIAIIERSGGNEQVGDMWLETKSFPVHTPVYKIMEWATEQRVSGKIILTFDQATKIEGGADL